MAFKPQNNFRIRYGKKPVSVDFTECSEGKNFTLFIWYIETTGERGSDIFYYDHKTKLLNDIYEIKAFMGKI